MSMSKLQHSVQMLRSKDEQKHEQTKDVFASMFGEEAGEAVGALLPLFSHRQSATRAAAIRSIGCLGELSFLGSGRLEALGAVDVDALFSALIVALGHKDYWVRKEASDLWIKLAWRERATVIKALVQGLKHAPPNVQEEVLRILAALEAKEATEAVASCFARSRGKVKSAAAYAIGRTRTKKSVQRLKDWLRRDPDWACYDATYALALVGNAEAINVLLKLAEHHDGRMRFAALSALGQVVSPISIRSVDGEEQESVGLHAVLGASVVEEMVRVLLGALRDEDVRVVSGAVDVLVSMQAKEAVAPLLEMIEQEEHLCQAQCVRSLGRLGAIEAVKPLIRMLQHPDEDLRAAAVYALGGLETVEAVDPLLGLLHDPSDAVREAVISALGGLGASGGEQVLLALMAALSDVAGEVRRAAMFALGYLGAKQAVWQLLPLLNDSSEDTQLNAIRVLGMFSAKEAVEPLVARWDGASAFLQSEIALALGKLGAKEYAKIILPLLRHTESQTNAVSALLQMQAFPADSAHLLLRMWEDTIRALPRNAYFLWRDEENISRLAPFLEALREEAKHANQPNAAEEWASWQTHLGCSLPAFIKPLREMRAEWSNAKDARTRQIYQRSQKLSDALERLVWVFQQEVVAQFAKDAEDALF